MRSYIEKENHIGPAVNEILRYRQTHTHILLLLYKDCYATLKKKIFFKIHKIQLEYCFCLIHFKILRNQIKNNEF